MTLGGASTLVNVPKTARKVSINKLIQQLNQLATVANNLSNLRPQRAPKLAHQIAQY